MPLTKYYGLWRDVSRGTLRKAREINRINADNAEKRLASLPKEATKQRYEGLMRKEKLRFVIAVQTIPRYGSSAPRYLTQVMMALNDILQESEGMDETALFICNTQRPPGQRHQEALSLAEYFPMVHISLGAEKDIYEREKQDYVFCLNEAQALSAEYVLLLQDDALPHSDFYSVLDYILKYRIENQIRQGALQSGRNDWLWLKLNFPSSLSKYERNYYFAIEWVSISLMGAFLFTAVVSYKQSVCCRVNGSKRTIGILPLLLVGFLYCMLLTWVIGRPYVNMPRTLSNSFYRLDPGTSCCLPAVLYPKTKLPYIVNYLETTTLNKVKPLDFALDEYREQSNLRQYLINPNLFSHIGVQSALHGYPNTRVAENYLFVVNKMKTPYSSWLDKD